MKCNSKFYFNAMYTDCALDFSLLMFHSNDDYVNFLANGRMAHTEFSTFFSFLNFCVILVCLVLLPMLVCFKIDRTDQNKMANNRALVGFSSLCVT